MSADIQGGQVDFELRKRSVLIAGHTTSVSLEGAFWDVLKRLAAERGLSLNALIAEIDQNRTGNLSSAIRLFVLDELMQRCGWNATGA